MFNIRLQNDDVQDFDTRWDQALLSASEIPTEMILEGLYNSKLQHSVQRRTGEYSKQWTHKLFAIEDSGNATY